MALNLQHQTAAEFAARFWARVQQVFASGDKAAFARLMWWLIERINAGDITDLQARNSFNSAYGRSLTAGEWTNLKTSRIIPAHDRWAAIMAEGNL